MKALEQITLIVLAEQFMRSLKSTEQSSGNECGNLHVPAFYLGSTVKPGWICLSTNATTRVFPQDHVARAFLLPIARDDVREV